MHQAQLAFRTHAVSRLSRSQPDGRERRFDRVRGPDVLPVCTREVVECEQLGAILDETLDRLRIFVLVGRHKANEGFLSRRPAVRLPDLVQRWLGVTVQALRQLVEYVCRFVDPAALLAGLRIDLGQRRPEAECAVGP